MLLLSLIKYLLVILLSIRLRVLAKVTEESPTSLKNVVEKNPYVIIEFFSKTCGTCVKFSHLFDTVSTLFPNVTFVRIDGSLHRHIAMELVGDAFPGVASYINGVYIDYMRTSKTKKSLILWILQRTGNSVSLIDTKSKLEKLKNYYPVVYYGNFSSLEKQAAKDFINFASKHRDWGIFALSMKPFNDKSNGSITVFHPHEFSQHLTNVSLFTNWIKENRFPPFGEMTQENQHFYYLEKKDPIIFLGTKNLMKNYTSTFIALHNHYKKNYHVVWIDIEKRKFSHLKDIYQLQSIPACIIIRGTGQRQNHQVFKFESTNKNISTKEALHDYQALETFINNVQLGKIRPFVQSEKKTENERLQRRHIAIVTGNNFYSTVLNSTNDYLLFLTTPYGNNVMPGCTACKQLLHELDSIYSNLEEILYPIKPPYLGEFRVTHNEFPVIGWRGTWNLDDLPVMYLLRQNETKPQEFLNCDNAKTCLVNWVTYTKQIPENQKLQLKTKIKQLKPL